MASAPPPNFTVVSPAASMFVRSVTLRFAFFAVAMQTPAEQLTSCVRFLEIEKSACAESIALVANIASKPGAKKNRVMPET